MPIELMIWLCMLAGGTRLSGNENEAGRSGGQAKGKLAGGNSPTKTHWPRATEVEVVRS